MFLVVKLLRLQLPWSTRETLVRVSKLALKLTWQGSNTLESLKPGAEPRFTFEASDMLLKASGTWLETWPDTHSFQVVRPCKCEIFLRSRTMLISQPKQIVSCYVQGMSRQIGREWVWCSDFMISWQCFKYITSSATISFPRPRIKLKLQSKHFISPSCFKYIFAAILLCSVICFSTYEPHQPWIQRAIPGLNVRTPFCRLQSLKFPRILGWGS